MRGSVFWKSTYLLCISAYFIAALPSSTLAQHEGHDHNSHKEASSDETTPTKVWTCSMHPQIELPHSGQCPLCKMDLIEAKEELEDYSADNTHDKGKNSQLWTCSMHPQIKLPEAGKCPICHMDLIPVPIDQNSSGPEAKITMSKYAEKLASIQTSEAKYLQVSKELRLFGLVDFDETQVKHITAWVPGRLDRLYVDYTGISVKKGDHMVYLYSPELISAQEELIQSRKALGRLNSSSSKLVRNSTSRSVKAAREKLLLLGLSSTQVKQIEKRGEANEWITIFAPMGGVVVQKHVKEGMYVQTGSQIYTIADLSHLWLHLDAYESDLPWLHYGQKVEFSTKAFPGELFTGVVSFIQPILDPKSRTVKIRVNVDNSSGLLKPNMFVTATVKAQLSADGKAHGPSFAGKYICPMHPEIVSDSAGQCSICGMDLSRSEELNFIGPEQRPGLPLVIPASAPLITGKRAIVYVKDPEQSIYSARQILLGPRAGDYYLVKSGLKPGELVVSKGSFKLDADLQIRGKVSMMNPKGATPSNGHSH